MDQLLLAPGWSSAGKMSTALTIIMHFTGGLIQKAKRNIPRMSRTSRTSWMKRVCFWPHNRVHPLTDSTEELPEDQLEELSISTLEEEALPNSIVSASYSSEIEVLLNYFIF